MAREEFYMGPAYTTGYLPPGTEVGDGVEAGTGVDSALLGEDDELGNVELIGEDDEYVGDGDELGNVELIGEDDEYVGDEDELGDVESIGEDELGNVELLGDDGELLGNVELLGNDCVGDAESLSEAVGAEVARKVIETARDNRRPPPPLAAVDAEAPPRDTELEDELVEVMVGAAEASGDPDPFPVLADLASRAGAGMKPRYVRVDTPESYRTFRAERSPEMLELAARLDAIEAAFAAHKADPDAHREAYEEAVEFLGAVEQAERAKVVRPWLPERMRGKTVHWVEGGHVGTTVLFPGGFRLVTSLEPERRCVREMAEHVRDAGVPASAVLGAIPAMACVLGAGTVLKEVAAAAPAIAARPEYAGDAPFVVRVEPAANPALTALAMLALKCRHGDAAACAEWGRLGELAPAPLARCMREALTLVQRGVEAGRLPGAPLKAAA